MLPRNYRFAGIHCGVRPDPQRLDLALVVSDTPACAAGVFTQNQVRAAPVQVCLERVPRADARGIVVCSGNANACTGEQGLADARRMTRIMADQIGAAEDQVLVCSTGVIGKLLPMSALESGIPLACKRLSTQAASFDAASRAILTTDTKPKISRRQAPGDCTVLGFAKGAAMIGPNMATMLGFLLCDACIQPADLAAIGKRAVAGTFNCISVEGHTSTNDTVLFMANGSGACLQGGELERLEASITSVCADLARQIAADAEGANHLMRIEVAGLRTNDEAKRIAKTIAESALVKTAIFGADPNWGRIISAAGYAGVPFAEADCSLWLGAFPLYDKGRPLPFDEAKASAYLKGERNIDIRLLFSLGSGSCTFWTCDLTYEYVRLNADYTT